MAETMPQILGPYCGPVPDPSGILGQWNFDPLLLATLAVALGIGWSYATRKGCFLAAMGVLILAFVSPLCALTVAFFSARALHHLLLVSLFAPLMALALPRAWLGARAALMLLILALLAWHIPQLYTAAWAQAWMYWAMQIALMVPAWLFWSAILAPRAHRTAEAAMGDALLLGALAGAMGLIGAVLTFAPRPLYPEHGLGSALWGTDALADQQLAGLVMWVPGLVPIALFAAMMLRQIWQAARQPA